MKRRDFLRQGMTVSAGFALAGIPKLTRFADAQEAPKWRSFEVVTKVEVIDPVGAVRAWVPIPLLSNTDYFKRQGDTWTGNYKTVRSVPYDKYTGIVFAEWPASEKAPVLEVSSKFMTRDRSVDLGKKPEMPTREDKAVLDYFRVSPVGPLLPLVFTLTTICHRLSLCVTYRTTAFSQKQAERIATELMERLRCPE